MKANADILARLQRDILSLQGHKPATAGVVNAKGLESLCQCFPHHSFPFAGVHEFFCWNEEGATASNAFISALLSTFGSKEGVVVWINNAGPIYPPALRWFDVNPEQVIFLHLTKEKEVAWAIEESLKCRSLLAVVGEMPEMSFTASRRFQLAIEQSGVALFVLRRKPRNLNTAIMSRWQIQSLQSRTEEGLPGLGHPHWQVKLLKARNGKPGTWALEWINGRFRSAAKLAVIRQEGQKKTG